ncbi:MAG: trigger factor family protein [Bacteroidetes bacterium]|nr:trigger factor family protein [Bacteroidota bacterium]
MNISKHQIDDLNAVISVDLQPEDYQGRVNQVLRNYQKTAKVPGFRPGNVPTGMIKKMYGKAVLVEELNRLLSEELGKYIYENKIEVLGSPLPKRTSEEQPFEEGRNFKFEYEIGLAPAIDVKFLQLKFLTTW